MDEQVLEVARAIRPFLGGLLPAQAEDLDRRIARILNAGPDENSAIELRALLESEEATSDFMAEMLNDAPDLRPPLFQQGVRRKVGLSGITLVAADAGKFGCPERDYVWYRPTSSTRVPVCPTHGLALDRLA